MTKLSEKLIAAGHSLQTTGNSRIAQALRRAPVPASAELVRIVSLPRRKLVIVGESVVIEKEDGTKETIPDLTPIFKRVGGTLKLRPLQNAALWEAYKSDGAFIPLGVGFGKGLISLLLPEVMNSKKTVLLVKPELKQQLLTKDVPFYRKHLHLPLDRIFVVAYSELSSARKADILERIKPDLIVADEAHSIRVKSSTRTRRFLRFMRNHPECRFVALSGTMSKRSIVDFAHLIELALRKNSPLPNNYADLEVWSEAIDATEEPRPPGALLQLCQDGESVRSGFRRRLTESPGVVASAETSIGTSLIIQKRTLPIPKKIAAEVTKLYETWQIDETELPDAMSLVRVARQLNMGFYYKWKWPNGIRDEEWLRARNAWNKEVRSYLQHTSRDGYDSPFLLATAAADGRWKSENWAAWAAVKGRPEPETVPVWIHDFVVADAINWGKQRETNGGGLIYYEHTAIGEAVARLGGWTMYGQGMDASTADIQKEPVLVCSIHAQSTGKNLQSWNTMLILSAPANGAAYEQVIGRIHRQGQMADEVMIEILLHCREFQSAFDQGLKDAALLEERDGQVQKLNFATKLMD